MSKVTKVTYKCDVCGKQSNHEVDVSNKISLMSEPEAYIESRAGEKAMTVDFIGDACHSCYHYVLNILCNRGEE